MDRLGEATRAWFDASFEGATPVQERGWGHIHAGEHTLLVAPTGSGKTLAAFLSCVDRLLHRADRSPGVRVVYVSPLKALAYDIERNLRAPLVGIQRQAERLGVELAPVRVDVRTGDTSTRERRHQRRDPAEILVTTAESLFLLLTSGARENLRTVQTVILDEIHVFAAGKRGVHLALTLERLAVLTGRDPQRIGLSATVRPVRTVARFLVGPRREVAIVDTAAPPHLDLRIVATVRDMENPDLPTAAPTAPSGARPSFDRSGSAAPATPTPTQPATGAERSAAYGIWPTIYPRLLELVRAHRTTLVFVNHRAGCERLTQRLNELAGEELVRAHHGSVSHAQRAVIEEQLKRGEVRGLVATSSLELGIDMGAIDLVVLVESPGSVARGLQRVGRAGHHVGAVSVGRIIPKWRGDLLECAVVAERMSAGEIEPIRVPTNCLDVLSQQLVAMCALDDWPRAELAALIRAAWPYADLTDAALASVLDMLSGRYPSELFASLAPRLIWDRDADVLRGRRGAQRIAVVNAGTIPDRGSYGVFLVGEGPRVGELDEEMVHESRRGDTFVLGASTWRVEEITRDKVIVSPAPGEPGRLPFWRGAGPGRPIELGRALGAFVRELMDRRHTDAEAWIAERYHLDPFAVRNTLAYVNEQREATTAVPSDRTIVVERFRDELGDWRICIHSCFGGRVNAPWALAIQARIAAEHGVEVQVTWTDDGIALRFADADEIPDVTLLLPDPLEAEELVLEQLRTSAMFASRFRENAARALLLPRKQPGRRTPLWAQRLRAQNLMEVVGGFPGFPIVLETYRECLQDVFDLPSLVELLGQVQRREIRIVEVEVGRPSPFARSLAFAYVASFLYDADSPAAERRAAALTLDRGLLRDLLGREELRDLLDADALAELEAELQHLAPDCRARHPDAVHDLLRRLGALTEAELAARCTEDPLPWLDRLADDRRAFRVRLGQRAGVWVAVEDLATYRDALGLVPPRGVPAVFLEPVATPLEVLVQRYARTHGPFRLDQLAAALELIDAQLSPVLELLLSRGQLVHGEIRPGGTTREWCDPEVLRRLRRKSLAKLRREVSPVDAAALGRFLPAWHGLGSRQSGLARLQEVLVQLEGLPLPWSSLVADILPARVAGFHPRLLDELGSIGGVVWIGSGALGARDGRVALYRRDRAALLYAAPSEPMDPTELGAAIVAHLQQRGASFLVELQAATGTPLEPLVQALWDLVWAGRITNDTFQPLQQLGAPKRRGSVPAGGRWGLVDHVLFGEPSPTERAHARALMLLERHGVATRESALSEEIEGGFTPVYQVLKELEAHGKVRRGYFVEGLGGAQFAWPGAVDRLRASHEDDAAVRVLAAVDPAMPFGGILPWPTRGEDQPRPRRVAGAVVALAGGDAAAWLHRDQLLTFPAMDDAAKADAVIAALLAELSRQRKRSVRLKRIDGQPARSSKLGPALARAGFVDDLRGLTWVR